MLASAFELHFLPVLKMVKADKANHQDKASEGKRQRKALLENASNKEQEEKLAGKKKGFGRRRRLKHDPEEDGSPDPILSGAGLRRVLRDMLAVRRQERVELDDALAKSQGREPDTDDRHTRLRLHISKNAIGLMREHLEQLASKIFRIAHRSAKTGRPLHEPKPEGAADPSKKRTKNRVVLGRHVEFATDVLSL